MQLFLAKVRVNPHQLIDVQLIAESARDAKEQLELQYGEGNVPYYPRLIV